MKNIIKSLAMAVGLSAVVLQGATAQGSEEYGSGLKVNLNDTGSKYVRFIIWNQVWLRAIQNNDNTIVNGVEEKWTYDAAIRRARFLAYAQISPRFMVLTHFGINNQTFVTGGVPNGGVTGNGGNYTSGKKPGIFFHDLWNEYAVVPQKNLKTGEARDNSLYVGSGLHYWHGLSRMTNASTLNFLAVDAPIFNWPTIELADQFARYLGVYAKGKLFKHIDYRFNISKPFSTYTPTATPPIEGGAKVLNRAVDLKTGNSWMQAGYASYGFFDSESNVLPFAVGTYVGTKKVLNVGAGFQRMPKTTQSWALSGEDTVRRAHDVNMLAVDVFADLPFGGEKNMAVTAYSVFYLHRWGPNYYRLVGIMNEASVATAGNARPLLGTGSIWYTQAGLLLPKGFMGLKDRVQPFAAYTLHNIERLKTPTNSFDLGFNYYISGHHSKLTLQYSSRPRIVSGAQDGSRGEFIVQAQVYL